MNLVHGLLLFLCCLIARGSEVTQRSGKVKEVGLDDTTYLRRVFQGICEAKCLLEQPDIQLPAIDEESGIFTRGVTCSSASNSSCHNCTLSQQVLIDESFPPCRREEFPDGSPWLADPLTLSPIFHCSTFNKARASFDVYFRLEFSHHNATLSNLTLTPLALPILFLVQVEVDGELSLPSPQSITPSWRPHVIVPGNQTFRIRVTPIAASGAYAPIYSPPIFLNPTPERGMHRGPKNLQVRRIRQNPTVDGHPDLQVLLHWESGNAMEHVTCSGLIWVLDADVKSHDYKTADETFWFNLTNQTKGTPLSFGTNYSIQIMEGSDLFSDEFSNATDISIRLPPCLQFFQNNFTMCPPPPPRGVRFVVMPNNSVLASWSPPDFTSPTNLIESYEVRLIKFSPHYSSKSVSIPATAIQYPTQLANVTVSGSATSVLFQNVSHIGLLQVIIRAFSKGGPSGIIFEGPHPQLDFADSVAHKFLLFGLVFASLAVLTMAAFVLKIRNAKKERQRARAKYFGDENDENFMLECPYFPTYCSKWLIDTSCIKMGGLIGEGNFGQVHAATLYKSQATRIVAIKTLKEGVNLGEKSKFWEEFQILKNLEPHPHVVRLIGIIKAHHPTLVVEYCDGGDLHSYLRKLRDDKVKRLTREKRRVKWMTSGTISGEFLRHSGSDSTDGSARYTTSTLTLGDAPSNCSAVTNEEYFYLKDKELAKCERENLDPVELNLLFSFGRQVAAGMEFLANNKIVHRDLAARNILVMHESKTVLKIADFGLSRDVYEKNWYKKSSDEKIPFKWLALECLLDEVYTTKSDVWSYGVLLWEIVTYGGSPYPGIKNAEIFELLKKGYRMSKPEGCPCELYALMRRTWEKDSDDRPDFATLRHHLDEMMEKSQSGDYLQLHESQMAEGQSSPEAGIKYSSLLLPDPVSETNAGNETTEDPTYLPPLNYSENLLYSSLDSNLTKRGTAPEQSRKSSSSTSLYDLHIPYGSEQSQYENEFCIFNINEKRLQSATTHDSPFEFEMAKKDVRMPHLYGENSPPLHPGKGEKPRTDREGRPKVTTVVFV